ncbi:MAG: hypothetical protein U5O39_19415 [Gammaproteobacteria bacterium]|nr:hypothetical protein [Gammaproteobacteria bacterium]
MSQPTTSSATVSLGTDGRIVVSGCLDVDTVAKCRDGGIALMAEGEGAEIVFDLSGTEVRGSASIALLIAWQRELPGPKRTDVGGRCAGLPARISPIPVAFGKSSPSRTEPAASFIVRPTSLHR